ncbi:sigma-54 interaction domain-containing protein [Desulfonatronovibrio hydrogenovorans]|uniref:sigma-54 interaction domain-containing protein n=1 Tax=Desulfonatronovibrio hydrogenovorans TaxID=53245 RepID=UPI000691E01D|nr:sigma-54 dependent transcriptional regulator [Desulfonatronovibrio hydrogenovorans]
MDKEKVLTPEVDRLLKKMEQICHDLAWNKFEQADDLFELTRQKRYPERIAKLAESFGMMLVKVEAREYRMEEMLKELQQARKQLLKENAGLKKGLQERFSSKKIIGRNPEMRKILDQVERIADTSVNVLITGETGTGKELIAKALHYNSLRGPSPFVAVNCSAVPETLFESELFGIEKGVATGVAMRKGLLEQAHKGTLFLDEIGDMPLSSQAKILRVLEERVITRVGGKEPIPVDIRVVAATNRDLKAETAAARFRSDLFFRLNVVSLCLPPLAERPEDLPLLVKRFMDVHCRSMNRASMKVSPEAMRALFSYSWPGNVRELENEVERLVALAYSSVIRLEDLSLSIRESARASRKSPAISTAPETGTGKDQDLKDLQDRPEAEVQSLAKAEKKLVQRALEVSQGNKTQAARLLGISREGLRKKMKRLF